MPACHSCQSEVRADAARCQRCGADVLLETPAPDYPALELGGSDPPPAAKPRPQPPAGRPPAPAAAAPARVATPAVGALGDLEIDLSAGSGALPARLQGAQSSGGLRVGPDGELMVPKAGARAGGASRTGLDEDGLDPYEVRAFADYGDVPEAFYLLPLYALRVKKRDGELRSELDRRAGLARDTAERIEDMVIAFGERVRPFAAANPIYKRAVAPIEEAERLVSTRDGGLAAETDAYKKTTAALDAKLGTLEADVHRIGQELAAREADLEKLEDARKRAETKAKRLEIEIRNAEAGLASGQGDGASLKLHVAEKREALERERETVASLLPLIAAQTGELDVPRAARAGVEREVEGVRRERVGAEQRLKRQTGARAAGVDDARKKTRAAMAEFARTALTDATTFGGEFDASRRAIEMLLREKADRELSVLMVEKALASADRRAVVRGIMVAVGGALALLLLVFGLPIYRVFVPVKAPALYPVDE